MFANLIMRKDLKYYLALPYTKIVTKRDDQDGIHYLSKVLELEGCVSDGETEAQALENLQEALECYLESSVKHNDNIPEPQVTDGFSGKFSLRLPKSLHHRLTIEAQKEGISLNQYALYKLSK